MKTLNLNNFKGFYKIIDIYFINKLFSPKKFLRFSAFFRIFSTNHLFSFHIVQFFNFSGRLFSLFLFLQGFQLISVFFFKRFGNFFCLLSLVLRKISSLSPGQGC